MADSMDDMMTSTAEPSSGTVSATSYSPDAMRSVITSLREEAATRAKLERKIVEEFEKGCEATRQEADRLIQETADRYDDKIASTKREYEELRQRVESQFRETEAQYAKQRDTKANQVTQQADRTKQQLIEDEHFAESTEAESFKEKRRDPAKLFTRDSKQLE